MSEKNNKTVKEIKDMTPDEFLAGLETGNSSEKNNNIKFKNKFSFKKFTEILGALGLFPVFSSKTTGSGRRGHGSSSHVAPQQSSSAAFRESHHFDPERAYVERIQERAYMQMVDGRGDPHECDCDHDR